MTDPYNPSPGYPEGAPSYPAGHPTGQQPAYDPQAQPGTGQMPTAYGDMYQPQAYAQPAPGQPGQAYPPQAYAAAGYPQQAYGPPGYPPGYGYPGGYPVALPRNGMGTAGLTLGILAIVFCWGVWLPWVLGVLAIIFGGVGMARAAAGQATNRSSAVAGLVMGFIALVLSILFWVWIFQTWTPYD